jgi:hypothetical protein
MPIHDWTRVPAGLFHDFHQTWSIHLKMALNAGRLPKGFSALVEQRSGPLETDVLSVAAPALPPDAVPEDAGGLLVLDRPVTSIMRTSDKGFYAARANRIVVRHHLGRIVAVIEIVSPGNKDSRGALREFVEKSVDLLRRGIHLLIIDLFPPSPRDPFGIYKAIWDEITEEEFTFPPGRDRTLVSFEATATPSAFVEPVGVGDALPDMALFLVPGMHLKTPLEMTYQQSWDACPEEMRKAVETGVLPGADGNGA